MRWPSASATACSAAALVVAGCGGTGERPPVLTSLRLSRLADRVAAGTGCGRALVSAAVAAVNRGEVPPAVQERLLSDVNRVAGTCSRARARSLATELRP
jgi:hypothetical protein